MDHPNSGPVAVDSHYFHARDGVRLHYRILGTGRAIILLHGLFSNAEVNWVKYGHAATIAAAGYRVIMPDLRGHGQSDASQEAAHYPADILCTDLADLVAHLGLEDFDLGGFSLGARTSVRALARGDVSPGRVILGGMGVEGLSNWAVRGEFFRRVIDQFDTAKRGDDIWMAVQFMKTMAVDRVAARHLLASLVDTPVDALAAIHQQTLVVCGSEDRDNGDPAALTAALPDARHAVIPGTHMGCIVGKDLGRAMAEFLNGPVAPIGA
ncbi:MAG: alpha/beta fold hydrolase [Sphingomonadaceae bacterium]|nr:alpha/beta fold hydrolase [Sphingomonadaceae bacterium]